MIARTLRQARADDNQILVDGRGMSFGLQTSQKGLGLIQPIDPFSDLDAGQERHRISIRMYQSSFERLFAFELQAQVDEQLRDFRQYMGPERGQRAPIGQRRHRRRVPQRSVTGIGIAQGDFGVGGIERASLFQHQPRGLEVAAIEMGDAHIEIKVRFVDSERRGARVGDERPVEFAKSTPRISQIDPMGRHVRLSSIRSAITSCASAKRPWDKSTAPSSVLAETWRGVVDSKVRQADSADARSPALK